MQRAAPPWRPVRLRRAAHANVAARVVYANRPRRQVARAVALLDGGKPLQVVFVTTEVAPWSQVGGLGDVMAALPAALAARGHRVMTVAPRYASYSDVWDTGVRVPVRLPTPHDDQPTPSPATGAAPEAAAAAAAPGVGYARYHVAPGPDGVVRVFVDHELFEAAPLDDRSPHRVPTYRPGGGLSDGAASLAAGYSVLCQAALAAPVLLWRAPGGAGDVPGGLLMELSGGRTASEVARQLAAAMSAPKAVVHGIARPVFVPPPNLDGSSVSYTGAALGGGSTARSSGSSGGSSNARAASPTISISASTDEGAQLAAAYYDGGGAAAWAAAAAAGIGLGAVHVGPSASGDAAQSPIVFVGNDWPTGVLPLWLETYRQAAGGVDREAATLLGMLKDGLTLGDAWAWGERDSAGAAAAGDTSAAASAAAAAAATAVNAARAAGLLNPSGSSRSGSSGQSDAIAAALEAARAAGLLNPSGSSSGNSGQGDAIAAALEAARSAGLLNPSGSSSGSAAQGAAVAAAVAAARSAGLLNPSGSNSDAVSTALEAALAAGVLNPSGNSSDDAVTAALDAARAAGVLNGGPSSSRSADPLDWGGEDDWGDTAAAEAAAEVARLRAEVAAWDARWGALQEQVAELREKKLRLEGLADSGVLAGAEESVAAAAAAGGGKESDLSPAEALAEAQAQLEALLLEEQLLGRVADELRSALAAEDAAAKLLAQASAVAAAAAPPPGAQAPGAADGASADGPADQARQLESLQRLLGSELGPDKAKVAFAVHNGGVDGEFGEPPSDGEAPEDAAAREAERLGISKDAVRNPLAAVADAARSAASAFGAGLARLASFGRSPSSSRAASPEPPPSPTPPAAAAEAGKPDSAAASASASASASPESSIEDDSDDDDQGSQGPSSSGGAGSGTSSSSNASASTPTAAATTTAPAAAAATEGGGLLGGLRGAFSWLQAGLTASDAVITVSPSYANEMLAGAAGGAAAAAAASSAAVASPSEAGERVAAALAAREASGRGGVAAVLNGLDAASWDPAADPLLPRAARLRGPDAAEWKARAKALLQRQLGLAEDPNAPIFAFLGRLESQKGADVVLAALPELLRLGGGTAQVAMLGAGQPWMERAVSTLPSRLPGRAGGAAGFSPPLARLLLAGADFLLIPSRFEPCGLVALAALRYGAVPIAAATGGLRDVVSPDVGYTFAAPGPDGDSRALRSAAAALVGAAAAAAAAGPRVDEMRASGMARDVSWTARAAEWEEFLSAVAAPSAEEEETATGVAPALAAEATDGAQGSDVSDNSGVRDTVSAAPVAAYGV